MALIDTDRPDLPVLTRKDVAHGLGVSVRTIDRLVAAGEIPHHRIGDLVKFTAVDVEAFIARCRVPVRSR